MMFPGIRLLILTVFIAFSASAGKIDKAFENLKIYNYFEAKQLFEKSMKKQPAPASYGLAVIYSRKDNPFYNLDSAYVLIQKAEKLYATQKEKTQLKLKKYEFDYPHILALRQQVSSDFYKLTKAAPSETAFQIFLDRHPWANEKPDAIHQRDSIAYATAKNLNTSRDYTAFLKKYPGSEYVQAATDDYNLRIYQEQTTSGTITELDRFITAYPSNPYRGDAEDRIYDLMTEKSTLENYEAFIRRYPSNRNAERAWRKLYQLYMYDYSAKRIEQFIADYPDYPFRDEVEIDRELSQQNLLPFRDGNLFGLMNYQGKVIFPAEYASLGFFKEGLSLAAKNDKYGYIDKANKTVIPFRYDSGFDFEEGRAIVEINDKFGIIDRTGKLLFDITFSDIGQFSEGLIYGAKDSLYAYYDKFGMKRIDDQFEEAFSFSNGMAQVEVGGKRAFIDPYGSYIVKPQYEEISFFTDSLLIFKSGDYYGIMKRNGKTVLPATMDEIGNLANGKAIIVKDDKIGYINDSARIVLNPMYEVYANFMENAQFSGNYAKAKLKGKYGIIDSKGKWIIPAAYNNLGAVSGMIAFTKGKKWGYIDMSNKIIVKPVYDFASSIEKGLAVVEMNGLQGMINAKGEWVIPAEFTEIKQLENDYFLVESNEKLGLYSAKGARLIAPTYEQIRIIDKDFLLLSGQGQVHYFYIPEQRIIVPQLKKH